MLQVLQQHKHRNKYRKRDTTFLKERAVFKGLNKIDIIKDQIK